MLVGSLKKKSQLDFILENNVYYMPFVEKVMGKELNYVAIFQSKNKFGEKSGVKYYASIKNIAVVKRKEIPFPTSRNPEQRYILFNLKEWNELDSVIKSEGYGVSGSHIYTNDMLLKKADTLPELSIKSMREWRIWLELKRMKKEIKIKIKNNKLRDLENIEGFSDGQISLEIKGNKLICKDKKWDYNKFLQNPRGVLKDLINQNF